MSDAAGSRRERRIGILTTDTDLVVKSWDAGLQLMTGIPADRALGRRIEEIIPDLAARVPYSLLREPLVSGTVQVLAPALHKFLIPCPPLEPSQEFDRMQQRVVVGALRDEERSVGLVVTVEDVTARLERERQLARTLAGGTPADRVLAVRELADMGPTDGLGPIQLALGDQDWQVRRSAVSAVAAQPDQPLVDALITALRDGHRDFSLLSSALQLLTVTGVDITDALVGLMQNPDVDLRIQVALALGTQRRPEALNALLSALNDPDPNVRFHAIEALGRLGHPDAIGPLADIMKSGDFFLAFPALEALVRINDPMVAMHLAPLLTDDMLGTAAAEGLGQLADEDAVVPLVLALDARAAPVEAIVEALTRIHHRCQSKFGDGAEIEDLAKRTVTATGVARIVEALGRASGATLAHIVVVLSWLRDTTIPGALARLLGRSEVRHEIIEAFVRFGASGVALLIEQLAVDDPDTKPAAIVALGRIGDRRATPALAAILLDDDARDLWVSAAGALARIGDGRAFEALCARLSDADAGVRQAVVGALNSIGHPNLESRVHTLLDDPRPLARESAVRIAGYFGYAGCMDGVFARCLDADESVRAAALEHLPYFDDARAYDALAYAVLNDAPRPRAAAALALGSIPGPQATALLARAIDDQDAWVRYFAAIALGKQAVASALPLLDRIARTDSAPHVAVAAIEAVGAIGGADALAILATLGRDDGERGHAAVRTLGRIRSSQSIDLLCAALRSGDPIRRGFAIDALARQEDVRAIELLQWTASGDADATVARAAFAALGTIANRSAALSQPAVAALAACLRESERRQDALETLAQLAPSAIPWLADLLQTSDVRARQGIVDALSRLSDPTASMALQRALSDEDAGIRCTAIGALTRFGTGGMSPRLALLAEQDPSDAVRRAASTALRRQGADPRDGGA